MEPGGENLGPSDDQLEGDVRTKRSTAKTVVAACVAILAVCGALYSGSRVYRQEQRRRAGSHRDATMSTGHKIPDPVGAEDARIRITVVLGHCVASAMDEFVKLAEAWPDKVRVKCYAYESPEGAKIVSDHDETLACIFINGENRFTLKTDGKKRELHFHGPPGESYSVRDVVEVVRMKMLELYGELPPDFDDVASRVGAPGAPEPAPDPEP
jgi:HAMP domain-containing protein